MLADDYWSFMKAKQLLAAKFDGTSDEEIAAWVFYGPELGGLAAYSDVHELDDPPRFRYSFDESTFDYVAQLVGRYFRRSDIDDFCPGDRFVTWKALVERWMAHFKREAEVVAFILQRLTEDRPTMRNLATDRQSPVLHPIAGLPREFMGNDMALPGIEACLFHLSWVKQIESADFLRESSAAEVPGSTDTPAPGQGRRERQIVLIMSEINGMSFNKLEVPRGG